NINPTLKFSAKDISGISRSIDSTVYPITSPLTVTASPPSGTYNTTQSVTLTASIPSTIYYTTDGTTPTVSSPNGPSPVSGITISSNSTLKFFAKDGSNTGPVFTAGYTIIPPPTVSTCPGLN